ncbi:MAG: sugar-transfer associated ATP-grasp domain-containing protein [Saprospiraceae bacterium]|nr:sugar-transfer associated ATP-grasp domain-containing protein [Saprospiraceae bacterium]
MHRFLYFGYYVKQLDRAKLFLFLNFAQKTSKKSKVYLLLDNLVSVFAYKISILEYFQFGFYNKSNVERKKWAGTGYMYEYQLFMNPKSQRHILDDKTQFYKFYGEFFVHPVGDITDLKNKPNLAQDILNNQSGKIVLKVSDGKCGKGVLIMQSNDFTPETLITFMETEGYDLVEAFLVQHPDLNNLSPSAVNTVRVFTQLNKDNNVELLGSRLRISVNSSVDNMAAGNMAAPIDEETGIVVGPGVYSDISKQDEAIHPITNAPIIGFQVPFWKETIAMVKQAALKHPQNRSIGWDVVITQNGPGLIEGNHDWCKLLWQLPVKRGLKSMLEIYL